MKETTVFNVSKEASALYSNDTGFEEYIRKNLSTELAERIMTILEYEPEIVIRQSNLSVEEFMPTNSFIYRRSVEWVRLVRCKDCKHRDPETKKCDCGHDILWQLPRKDDWYCADGEEKDGRSNQQTGGD